MTFPTSKRFAILFLALTSAAANGQSIEVLAPASDQRIAEGHDYATWKLGNRWDMRCPDWSGLSGYPGDPVWDGQFTCDLVVSRNRCVTNELFDNGSYFATSTSTCNDARIADPNLVLVSPGPVAGVGLSNGRLFPIDTAVYRHFTVKIRTLNTNQNQGSMVFFQTSADANDPFGRTNFGRIEPGGWNIVSFDLQQDVPSGSQLSWTGQVIGFRYDPVPNDGIDFEIEWARLSADPALAGAPDTSATVQWTTSGLAPGSLVTISAVDQDGAELVLAEGVSADEQREVVDVSRLAPGAYSIRVAGSGVSDISTGRLLINSATEFKFTQPDRRGDQTRDYAADVLGNPWGLMDAEDIIIGNNAQTNLENIAFLGGELVADAPDGGQSPGDPRMTFETASPINTSIYRMLSFEFRLEMVPGQIGSVARVHWGTSTGVDPAPDTVTDDIRVRQGFNTYVLGDMGNVPDKDGQVSLWNGGVTVLRFDPHEVDATRGIVFRSLRLSPMDTAAPSFRIKWDAADEDAGDELAISLYRDTDSDPSNGNEILIVDCLDGQTATEFIWDASGVPAGEYRILAEASDGFNSVSRYASGPIKVTVASPDLIFGNGFE